MPLIRVIRALNPCNPCYSSLALPQPRSRYQTEHETGMIFDTKVAIAVLDELPVWQKLNVTAFLATGIAAAAPASASLPAGSTCGAVCTQNCSANRC